MVVTVRLILTMFDLQVVMGVNQVSNVVNL
ncbi:hypothetical protein SDC9_125017 [bioreactor metagenome]|uniref:Uncharacterized protein n=1 Tax=bioreactor metagenome TaxID=1076179 RepID=A0A645CM77_9ZZZZ